LFIKVRIINTLIINKKKSTKFLVLFKLLFVNLRIQIPLFFNYVGKVLNISEAATIAIHSMSLIAKSSNLIGAQEISDITGFPRSHISKVLSQLTKNKYLDSIRGPGGGFKIRGSSEKISLMDIYRLFDGEIQESTNCRMKCESCPFGDCIFGGLAKRFSKEFEDYLNQNSLATIT